MENFRALSQAIAAGINGIANLNDDGDHATIELSDGAKICFLDPTRYHYSPKGNRLIIRGEFSRLGGKVYSPIGYGESRKDEITFAADTDPAKIARRIVKQLLPLVREYTAKVNAYIKADQDYKGRQDAIADRLTAALPGLEKSNGGYHYNNGDTFFNLQISSDGARLDAAYFTTEQLEKMFKAIA